MEPETVERPAPATQTKEEGKTAYLVLERQRRVASGLEEGGSGSERSFVLSSSAPLAWVELGTVELPKRSRSVSAVAAMLDQLKRDANAGGEFRVIPADEPVYTLREKPLPPVEERFEVVAV